jgi:hypothetical protein
LGYYVSALQAESAKNPVIAIRFIPGCHYPFDRLMTLAALIAL